MRTNELPDEVCQLVELAASMRERAVAPYSQFRVGAALETKERLRITGCNIEIASYGLTICAERVAIFKAISEAHKNFVRIAVVADTTSLAPPCGACRQVLWELGGDLEVVLANLEDAVNIYQMRDLLPYPFDGEFLAGR